MGLTEWGFPLIYVRCRQSPKCAVFRMLSFNETMDKVKLEYGGGGGSSSSTQLLLNFRKKLKLIYQYGRVRRVAIPKVTLPTN
jgi:hypothetical protein